MDDIKDIIEDMGNEGNEKGDVYIFSFMANVENAGAIHTVVSEEDTKKKVETELLKAFGEGGYEITEFRKAEEDEAEVIRPQTGVYRGTTDNETGLLN